MKDQLSSVRIVALENEVRRMRAALGLVLAGLAIAGLAQCGATSQGNDRIMLQSEDGESQVILAATPEGPVVELRRAEASVSLRIHDVTGPTLGLNDGENKIAALIPDGKPILTLDAGGAATTLGASPERAFMQSCITEQGCVQSTMTEHAAQLLVQHGDGTTQLLHGASGGGLSVDGAGSRAHVRVQRQGPEFRLEGPRGLTEAWAGGLTLGGRDRVTRVALNGDMGAIQIADPGHHRLRDLR